MPALPTVVSDYIQSIKDALSQGVDLGSNVQGNAQNYLRAQDMATVLDLLQDAMDTGTLTAVGGSTISVSDAVDTFAPGQQVGNTVTFVGNTTAALAGVTAVVASNTSAVLTFTDYLPAAPQAGDEFTIEGTLADDAIDLLREGRGIADSPRGSVYGEDRVVRGALSRFVRNLATQATGTLTLTGNATNGETVTIDEKTYTFQDTLTDVDGNVHIAASASDTIDNLIAAITLGSGAGTAYATSMTEHPSVTARAGAGDTMDVTAKDPGTDGNSIATTETMSSGSWGDTTLTGGTFGSFDERTLGTLSTEAGSTTSVLNVDNRGVPFRIDQFRGVQVKVAGETRMVRKSLEDSLVLDAPLSSAPSAGVDVLLKVALESVDSVVYPSLRVHPGNQPGHNVQLAEMIENAEAAVVAHTVPT